MSEDPKRAHQYQRIDKMVVAFRVFVGFAIVAILGFMIAQQLQILSNQSTVEKTLKQVGALVQAATIDKTAITVGTEHGEADYQAICNTVSGIAVRLDLPDCVLPYPAKMNGEQERKLP